jgi:hypothetical protein
MPFSTRSSEEIPDQHDRVVIRKIIADLQAQASISHRSTEFSYDHAALHSEQLIFVKRLRSVADRFLIVGMNDLGRIDGDHIGWLRKTPPTLREAGWSP